jgi:EAL domain-containing protein (putative c-di-GMP-specific phosphodiesterase class I)
VARRILHDLTKPFVLNGHEVFISASIGISLYPSDGQDVDTLLKNADIAMYHAKEQGKNNFQFYTDSMNATALDRLHLENEMRKALERNEFQLYFQPKVRVENQKIIGVEALLRWNHPKRGLLSPAEFIPLAEETGLIVPIGQWVLRTACEQGKAWQAEGLAPLTISVNISQRQFEQDHFLESVLDTLESTNFPPHLLELEITESLIMHDPEKVIALLGELKNTGIIISIDDFGTGYSSLEYLRRLPLDALKIDRSFITHTVSNPDDAAIARAVIAMAHSLNLKVIAEGVENNAQLEFLRGLDCDEAQGFLFSRPVPPDECARLMSTAVTVN